MATDPKREPPLARVLQGVLLIVGLMLVIGVLLPGRWAAIIVGGLLIMTGVPPLRPFFDRWSVGKAEDAPTDQATLYRVGAGLTLFTLGLLNIIRF